MSHHDYLAWAVCAFIAVAAGWVFLQLLFAPSPHDLDPPANLRQAIARQIDASDRIVNNWRDAWKWVSTNAMVLAGALTWGFANVPENLKPFVPSWVGPTVVTAVLALGVIGRLVKQSAPPCPPESPAPPKG